MVDITAKGILSYWALARVYSAFIIFLLAFVAIVEFPVGLFNLLNSSNNLTTNVSLYVTSIILLIALIDYINMFLQQFIALSSMIISVERAFKVRDLPCESELKTPYD